MTQNAIKIQQTHSYDTPPTIGAVEKKANNLRAPHRNITSDIKKTHNISLNSHRK